MSTFIIGRTLRVLEHVLAIATLIGSQVIYWLSDNPTPREGHAVFWLAWAVIAAGEGLYLHWDITHPLVLLIGRVCARHYY